MKREWSVLPVVVALLIATSAWATTGEVTLTDPPDESMDVPWQYTNPSSGTWQLDYGLYNWTNPDEQEFGEFSVQSPYPIDQIVTGVAMAGGSIEPISSTNDSYGDAVIITIDADGDTVDETWHVYWNSSQNLTFEAEGGEGIPQGLLTGSSWSWDSDTPWFTVQYDTEGTYPGDLENSGLNGDGPVPAPEPGSLVLLALGLPGVAFRLFRRRRSE